ncbi:tyrosine-type recombinase/integrase [Neoroseomonas soli]|uniref:Integrase arm-type DNA-binding domain-containing protein n=1 Tax=Neoroseomonas soli TaxID=1081025 RepID=A0A9X9WVH3_9PROT|nr:site-specific integrase [Neoroseomonas soli]MBR0671152.1 integrase arm-type DNA-binding domain-containing protein [Neoroseomonas soli]
MLTEVQIKAARPGRYSDGRGDGLMLFVSPTGAKKWVQRIKVGARYREIGHGGHPEVGLAEARRRAAEAKLQVAAGVDPIEARRQVQAVKAAPLGRTLKDAVEGYIAAHGPAWRSPKTATLFRRSLEDHAAGLLARDPAGITLDDVHSVLAPIWSSKPVLAQKVRSRLEHSLEWSMAAGWRPHGLNPAAWRGAIRTLLAKPGKVTRNRHHPALPWSRIPEFIAALRDEVGNAARCLEWVVLTASRSGEARGATWSEIDLDSAIWAIPAARMKAGRAHRVPLSAPAVALLRAMLPKGGVKPAQGLIFPNSRTGAEFSDAALLALLTRMDAGSTKAGGVGWRDEAGQKATPHGMRSAFRDWCGDAGHPREIAEAALAHAMGSATERAYARSDLFERRRVLMDAWAITCDGAAQPGGNVVQIARGAA